MGVTFKDEKFGQPRYFGTAATAYGDSFTVGTDGDVTAGNSYIEVIASATGWTITNLAVGARQIADIAKVQCYATEILDDSVGIGLYGFNDIQYVGTTAADQLAYLNTLRAALVWQAIPEAKKLLGNSGSITFGGSWSNNTTYGRATGKKSTASGATATATLYGTAVYIGYAIDKATPGGSFSITIDGVSYGSIDTGVGLTPLSGITLWPNCFRVADLEEGSHTVVLTVAAGGKPVYLDFLASNDKSTYIDAPRVYAGNTCRRTPYAGLGSDDAVAQFNAMQQLLVQQLAADGLNVVNVDASNQYNPHVAAERSADLVHPTNTGHANIAKAFLVTMTQMVSPNDRQGALYANHVGHLLSYNAVSDRIGIGHVAAGSVGLSKLDIIGEAVGVDATKQSALQMLTKADVYPLFQVLASQHNTVFLGFDVYRDETATNWISGHNSVGYVIGKTSGNFDWYYTSAAAAGSTVFPTVGMRFSSNNLLTTGYARFGSLTVPANTTAGDVTAARLALGNVTFAGTGAVLNATGNVAVNGWVNVAASLATPAHTAAGDFNALNGYFTNVTASGSTLTDFFTVTSSATIPAIFVTTLADSGLNTRITLSSSGPNVRVTGSQSISTYLNVGSASVPTNTTAGDLTFVRGYSDSAVIGSSPTGGNEGTGTINVASGYYVNGTLQVSMTFGNPSGTIGLAAVNGSASTAMRSDGAPALSQAIAPTWTAAHLFSQAGIAATSTNAIRLINSTASTALVPVQQSPSLKFSGHAWNTGGGGTDTYSDAKVELVPVSAAIPSSKLSTLFRVNSGTDAENLYSERMSITSAGVLDISTGYRIAAAAASGAYLRGDGTNFVSGSIALADFPAATRGDIMCAIGGTTWTVMPDVATGSVLMSGGVGADPAYTANPKVSGYLRVGSTSVPTNTTAGDLTFIRGIGTNAAMGSGATLSSLKVIDINETFTDTSATDKDGIRVVVSLTPSGAGASSIYGCDVQAAFPTAGNQNITDVRGLRSIGQFRGDGTATGVNVYGYVGQAIVGALLSGAATGALSGEVVGVQGFATNNSTSSGTIIPTARGGHFIVQHLQANASLTTITTAVGVESKVQIGTANARITTAKGVYINLSGNTAGTIATGVGLDIDAWGGGATITTQFGIRNASNMVQTGYLHLGGITAPSNTTDGDFHAVRAVLGTDAAMPASTAIYLNAAVKVNGSIGFFNTAPQTQQAGVENVTNNVTAGGTTGTIADITDITTYSNAGAGAAIRNDLYQLARSMKQVKDALRLYGLLS